MPVCGGTVGGKGPARLRTPQNPAHPGCARYDARMHANVLGRKAAWCLGAAWLASAASAQTFDLDLNPVASTSVISGTYAVDLTTTVIGDYDSVTNPTGTQTIPGLFGGGGNNPIPVDVTLSGPLDHNGPASGSMVWQVDRLGGSVAVSGLDWDLLGGQSVQSDVTMDLLYSTFRTLTPNSTFFGGFPVQVPGGTQSLQGLVAQQSAPALGALTPTGLAGQYNVQVVVPVEVSLAVIFNGTATPVGPVLGLLPLVGTATFANEALTVDLNVQQSLQQTVNDPLPGFQLMDVPLPVPTVLPPGATANLLLSGTVDQVDLDWNLNLALQAGGTAQPGFSAYCEVGPNSTGFPGTLAVTGSTDVAQADLTLSVAQLPAGVFGIYLMSPAQGRLALAPPAQGILCLGAPFFRFSDFIYATDAGGAHSFAMPFQQLPQNQTFQAGSTWNFQAWHRDMNPGATSNLTHGVTVTFQP